MVVHYHILCNLSRTLILTAHETAVSLANLQKSVDSLTKVVLGNRITLDYIFAEEGGVCMTEYNSLLVVPI